MDQSHTPMRGDVAGEEPPRSMDMLQAASRKNRKKKRIRNAVTDTIGWISIIRERPFAAKPLLGLGGVHRESSKRV